MTTIQREEVERIMVASTEPQDSRRSPQPDIEAQNLAKSGGQKLKEPCGVQEYLLWTTTCYLLALKVVLVPFPSNHPFASRLPLTQSDRSPGHDCQQQNKRDSDNVFQCTLLGGQFLQTLK